MISSYILGIIVEYYAMLFLKLKRYKILHHRYKTYVGELDIVACQNNTLVFIEVKYRKNQDLINYAVNAKQLHRIYRAASLFIAQHPVYTNYDIRFDILLINKLSIHHLKNVWQDYNYSPK